MDEKEKKKVLKINPKTTVGYIRIFNGMFNLTDKEVVVLASFIDKHTKLQEHGIDVFTSEVKKQIADELSMDNFNTLNNYIKAFKDKQAIRKTKNTYQINPLLIRGEEQGVYFKYA